MHRLESVSNALEQAKQAAAVIAGRPLPAPEVTWNWSDQYDVKLQQAGIPFDSDEIVVRGDTADAKFAVFHLKGSMIQAVEAVNAAPEFMAGRQLIGTQRPIDRAKLANPAFSMKEIAAN
jgi:3-phenylpropionate/trans-cinnamate dioxygenase ferredoxin reductase subunit